MNRRRWRRAPAELPLGVLTALTAIHGTGIVHRDLKPGNVLLSETGPRVIDFGISGALEFTSGLTATNQWLGTRPSWPRAGRRAAGGSAPPERIRASWPAPGDGAGTAARGGAAVL